MTASGGVASRRLTRIENPLFYNPKTVMLFGDAKESIDKLIADVKPL